MARMKEEYIKRDELMRKYVQDFIIPLYKDFDKGHNHEHAMDVIAKSLCIANETDDVCPTKVYLIAAFHDLGLREGRKDHEKRSAQELRRNAMIKHHFTQEEIDLMAEAVEDHRASNKYEPRSIYGKIVADGDRTISYENYMRRVVNYRIKEESRDEAFAHSIKHLKEKYGRGGYMKLWFNFGTDAEELVRIQDILEGPEEVLRADFNRVWDEEKAAL